MNNKGWILLPEGYQPDTKDSRKESGMKYVKYYSEDAYSKLQKHAEAMVHYLEMISSKSGHTTLKGFQNRIDQKMADEALEVWQNFKDEM